MRIQDLPMQRVGDEHIVHLGSGHPAWAGRHVHLCAETGPIRRVRFKVREPEVVLDCNGVVFDGSGDRHSAPVGWALDVDRTPAAPIHDVTIEHCIFRGYARGLRLAGPDIAATAPPQALQRFHLRNLAILDVEGDGIYVGPHSRDFLVEHVLVRGARLTGLYLEAYSSHTTVRHSRFEYNGYSSCSLGREGIAIDASTHNIIEHNVFVGNRFAGVTLYKNCGEGGKPRTWPASHNRIAYNELRHHHSHEGGAIIIASRQGMDPVENDCVSDVCLDPPAAPDTRQRRDHARDNLISHNRFVENVISVRVHDSANQVEDNVFEGGTWRDPIAPSTPRRAIHHMVIGSPLLQALGTPVEGVEVLRNRVLGATQGAAILPGHGARIELRDNLDGSGTCLPMIDNQCELRTP